MKREESSEDSTLGALEEQIGLVMEAIKRQPARKNRILTTFLSNIFMAVKETLRKQGWAAPLYMVLADGASFGIPPLTEELIAQAKENNAEAIVTIEGFHSKHDIGELIYHVSMSAPSFGVKGWILKVRIQDGSLEFVREWPYFFDTKENVRTVGEILAEMEGV